MRRRRRQRQHGSGEFEAAARHWRAGRRRKRSVGGRGVGRRAVLEGREEAVSQRDVFTVF